MTCFSCASSEGRHMEFKELQIIRVDRIAFYTRVEEKTSLPPRFYECNSMERQGEEWYRSCWSSYSSSNRGLILKVLNVCMCVCVSL